jgi:hypothetical protein
MTFLWQQYEGMKMTDYEMTKMEYLFVPKPIIYLPEPVNIGSIPEFENWREMRQIQIDQTNEWLFYIRDSSNNKLALKIFKRKANSYDYYYQAYRFQQQIEDFLDQIPLILKSNRILSRFGLCSNDEYIYFLLPWQHEISLADQIDYLPFYNTMKPALCAASYLRAAESVPVNCDSAKWIIQIQARIDECLNNLRYRSMDLAALNHFERFYNSNRYVLQSREISLCYKDFSLEQMYYQADGGIKIPLISNWTYADPWYHFRCLLTEIYPASKDLAIFLVDSYFKFAPPKEFFVCLAIYTMLDLFEDLCVCSSMRSEQALGIMKEIRAVDHMYAKFRRGIPVWYKPLKAAYRERYTENRLH